MCFIHSNASVFEEGNTNNTNNCIILVVIERKKNAILWQMSSVSLNIGRVPNLKVFAIHWNFGISE